MDHPLPKAFSGPTRGSRSNAGSAMQVMLSQERLTKIAFFIQGVTKLRLPASITCVALPVRAATFTFTAVLTSGQEPPPNTNDSPAFGVALMTFNAKTGELCFSISYEEFKLTSAETNAHFHAPAPQCRCQP